MALARLGLGSTILGAFLFRKLLFLVKVTIDQLSVGKKFSQI
jgi:hypothetical protein